MMAPSKEDVIKRLGVDETNVDRQLKTFVDQFGSIISELMEWLVRMTRHFRAALPACLHRSTHGDFKKHRHEEQHCEGWLQDAQGLAFPDKV